VPSSLKNNPFGIDQMAMKADGNDHDKMLDFINKFVITAIESKLVLS